MHLNPADYSKWFDVITLPRGRVHSPRGGRQYAATALVVMGEAAEDEVRGVCCDMVDKELPHVAW